MEGDDTGLPIDHVDYMPAPGIEPTFIIQCGLGEQGQPLLIQSPHGGQNATMNFTTIPTDEQQLIKTEGDPCVVQTVQTMLTGDESTEVNQDFSVENATFGEQVLLNCNEGVEDVMIGAADDQSVVSTGVIPIILSDGGGGQITAFGNFMSTIDGQGLIILAANGADHTGAFEHVGQDDMVATQLISGETLDTDEQQQQQQISFTIPGSLDNELENIEVEIQQPQLAPSIHVMAKPDDMGESEQVELSQTLPDSPEGAVVEEEDPGMQQEEPQQQMYVLSVPADEETERLNMIVGSQPGKWQKMEHGRIAKESGIKNRITQAWFTTKDEKVALQSEGHQWRQGQWTKDEIELLNVNIANYCAERKITEPTEIIFEFSKEERKDFYRTVARGLHRPLFSVYRRVIRMYDRKNHIGKYTPEEIERLKELRHRHGSDWATIGGSLGRSASSVKDRCRLMRDTCNSGQWLPEEEKRLAESVYELSGASLGESVTSGLSWTAVAEKVGTRSEKQCRTKWLNYLNWKQLGGTEWTRTDDMMLIERLSALNVSEETELDWNVLSSDWPSARSPQWLRGKWWTLKRHVPEYQIRPLPELLEALKTIHAPKIKLSSLTNSMKGNISQISILSQPMLIPVDVSDAVAPKSSLGGASMMTGADCTSEAGDHAALAQDYAHMIATTSSPGTFLITQPHNNPAISLAAGSQMSSDHIIVHTLPMSQDNDSKVCFTTNSIGGIQLEAGIAQSNQDLQSFESSEQMEDSDSHIDQTELGEQDDLDGDHEIITTGDIDYEVREVNISNLGDHVATLTSDDLVARGIPQHYVQISADSGDLMQDITAFSGHTLLQADGTDLIGATPGVESDKDQLIIEDANMNPGS